MKKTVKKLMVIMMIVTMFITTLGVSSAATAPSAADKATIRVKGIEAGSTVTAYHVVEATYNAAGLTGYKTLAGVSIADISKPTEAEVTAIAQKLYAGTLTLESVNLTYDSATLSYTSNNAEAGSYIILVTNTTGEFIYNPAYVSNAYADANLASSLGQQSGNGNVDFDGGNSLVTTGTVYSKKSYTSLDKDIVNSSTGNSETEDVAVGDTVSFIVTTTIPDYSDGFAAVDFTINDTADAGLGTPTNIVVKTGVSTLSTLASGADTYTVTVTGNDWTIDFADSWVKNHPLEKVEITYDAKVTDSAVMATDGNYNKATLVYTTVPEVTYSLDDTVGVYTFEISAEKVDADNTATKLSGAEFELKRADGKIYTATSDANGVISFSGLDVGVYNLREVVAPADYNLSTKTYKIEISAVYETDSEGVKPSGTVEKITSYKVVTTDNDTNSVVNTATFTSSSTSKDIGLDVLNTTLSSLPSTGGIGTVAFTVGGLILIAIACAVLFRGKKEA